MSKLSECMAKARMPSDDMAELRQHANDAGDERDGVNRYLASLHDDLESLRTQLADKGHDLSVRRVDTSAFQEEPQPKTLSAAARPQSLLEWLAGYKTHDGRRGMFDDAGELRSRNALQHFIPGRGKPFTTNKAKGISPDYVREAAIEAGYLPEGATENDLYALIDRELAGNKQYPLGEVREPSEREARDRNRDEMEQVASEHGIDPSGLSDKELEAVLTKNREWERADQEADRLEREAIEADVAEADNAGHGELGNTEAPRVEGEGHETGGGPEQAQEGPRGGPASGEGGGRNAPPDRGPPKEEPAKESELDKGPAKSGPSDSDEPPFSIAEKVKTVDGEREQLVIPGAERSAKQAAEARPERLKGAKPQKPADEGLFGEGHKQGTLFEQDRAPAGWERAENEVGVSKEEVDAATKAMRDALDQAGLHDIGARVADGFSRAIDGIVRAAPEVQGSYDHTRKLVALAKWVALGGKRPHVLGHEMVHAMKALGLFTDKEWSTLKEAAGRLWRDKYRIDERYPNLSEEKKTEEAIAEGFGAFYAKAGVGPKTAVGRVLQRAVDALKAIGRWTTGKDGETYLKVFEAMHRGDIGRRERVEAGAEPSAQEARTPKSEGGIEDARGRTAQPAAEPTKFEKLAERGPLGRTLQRTGATIARLVNEHAPALMDIAADIRMKLNPMSAGSPVAQAAAKDFANGLRQSVFDWNRIDRMLQERFTPEQQKRMWEAADEQSVLLQQGKSTKGKGLDRLAPDERAVVQQLQDNAKQTFDIARKLGMIESEGLPSYVPRIVADLASGKPLKSKSGESSSTLDGIGGNLRTTTSQLLNRKHLTVEATEAAAKEKFGEGAGVIRNIRTLAMATAKLQQAIAGRALVNKIKEIGRQTGADTVADHIPADTTYKWFTIDTPALKTWRPKMVTNEETGKVEPVKDQNGEMQFEKVPVYVRGDFEGPLRAVLSQKEGPIMKALMALKAKAMGVVMYSPLIHNGVEWGRALAAMPGKVATFKVYFEGNAAKKDPATMREAINAGLVPIGARYGMQDITSMMEEPNMTPGRSWTAQILGFLPGLVKEEAGTAVKRGIDKAGDIWHNTLLWDRVADLQMGLYTNFRDNLVKKGADPVTAQRLAAHLANRYAGALPLEAMSAGARKFANVALFSRTFTLGNIGAMKDTLAGVPSDVQAQIQRDSNAVISRAANSYIRRKSATIMGVDIGLNYLMNAAFTSGIAVLLGNTSAKDEAFGYIKRLHDLLQRGRENPLDLVNPIDDIAALTPQSANEPGKQDRVYVGRAADNSGIYMRLPMGKIGEEFEGWLTRPIEMLKNKTSTIARPLIQTFENDKGFGRHVYDPYDNAPGASVRAIGNIVANFFGDQFPTQLIDGVKGLITGEGDHDLNAAEALGPLTGVTFSKGAPGGPEMGEYYTGKREHDAKVADAMPDVRKMIREGKRSEAIQRMTELGIPPRTQGSYIRSTLNPRHAPSPQQLTQYRRFATPEQQKRLTEAAAREANTQ